MKVLEEMVHYHDPKSPNKMKFDDSAPDAVIVPVLVEDADPARVALAKQEAVDYVKKNFVYSNLSIDKVEGPVILDGEIPPSMFGQYDNMASSVRVLSAEEYLKLSAKQNLQSREHGGKTKFVVYVRVRRVA